VIELGLKGFLPIIGDRLGMTNLALYERQRELVRAGLLEQSDGRGPGSGVKATPRSISVLVISVLATERLSEVKARSSLAAGAETYAECALTNEKSFLNAVTHIFANPGLARFVDYISVSRTAGRAEIRFTDAAGIERKSEFFGNSAIDPGVSITATLSHALLHEIISDMQKFKILLSDNK